MHSDGCFSLVNLLQRREHWLMTNIEEMKSVKTWLQSINSFLFRVVEDENVLEDEFF